MRDGAASPRPPEQQRRERARVVLAVAAVIVWAVGAGVTRRVGYWTGLGGTAVGLGTLCLLVGRPRDERLIGYRLALGAAIGCGVVMAIAAWTLYPALGRLIPSLVDDKIGLYAAFAALPRLEAAVLLPVIIAGEELVWRGVVQEALIRRTTRRAAVLWCALIYGLATLPCGSLLLASTAFACGLVWSGLRVATGGVLAPIACHLLWAVLVLFVRPVRLG